MSELGSQTDQQYSCWTFFFVLRETEHWRERHAEALRKWLEEWNPPKEWMQ